MRATSERLRDLGAKLPELARIDLDELELALDLIPVCVLAWRPPEQAQAIAQEFSDLGVQALDVHALNRLHLNCPLSVDSLCDISFAPAFYPCTVVRATRSRSQSNIDLQIWTAREQPDSFPLAMRMNHGLDLDNLRTIDIVSGTLSLDASTAAPLQDSLAALRTHPDPEPADENHRDGMEVELRMPDGRGGTLVVQRWSPRPNDAPRLHAAVLALLDTCPSGRFEAEIDRRLAALRRSS